MDARLIGQHCEYCNDIITPEHLDARFYSIWETEDEQRVFEDIPVCCDACHDEIDDGNRSFAFDMQESGMDGDYDY